MGLRASLDAVVKRKISCPRRESKPRTPIVQPVSQRYTDWGLIIFSITLLLLYLFMKSDKTYY
jgi:hypothetical protein